MKEFWESKTVWFGVLVALIPILEEMANVFAQEGTPGWVVTIIGILVIVLRTITREPIIFKRND